jgi:hypothetical protein
LVARCSSPLRLGLSVMGIGELFWSPARTSIPLSICTEARGTTTLASNPSVI